MSLRNFFNNAAAAVVGFGLLMPLIPNHAHAYGDGVITQGMDGDFSKYPPSDITEEIKTGSYKCIVKGGIASAEVLPTFYTENGNRTYVPELTPNSMIFTINGEITEFDKQDLDSFGLNNAIKAIDYAALWCEGMYLAIEGMHPHIHNGSSSGPTPRLGL